MGIAPVGVTPAAMPLDPLGACWECHVFGCRAHGERDAGSGKWLCYASVDKALAASAGLPDPSAPTVSFADSDDFTRRFSDLANATRQHRQYWRSGPGEGRLGSYLARTQMRGETRWDLLADALGVGTFLLARPPHGREPLVAEPRPPMRQVLPPSLIDVWQEVGDA